MQVAVLGCGHVGLVTAATLASLGHEILGLDRDQEKVSLLKGGRCPFFETGLPELVEREVAAGRLRFEVDDREAIAGAAVVFICVETPARANGEANLAAVERAARWIAPA
jgi:UDP-glucose 6-dehydrogenase